MELIWSMPAAIPGIYLAARVGRRERERGAMKLAGLSGGSSSAAKRRATDMGAVPGAEATAEGVAAMGGVQATIGEGDHEQPLMLGVLQAVRELAQDMQDLKLSAYRMWEGPRDWNYVAKGMELRKEYGTACSKARGTAKQVGGIKTWMLMALYWAHQDDPKVGQEAKKQMEELVGKLVKNADGDADMANVMKLSPLVTHVSVAEGRKASYITIAVSAGEGEKVLQLLEEAWGIAGRRQTEAAPPKPVMKELKDAERKARAQLKGGAKGAGR